MKLETALILIVAASRTIIPIVGGQVWEQRCEPGDRRAFVVEHFGGFIVFDADCLPQTMSIEAVLDDATLQEFLAKHQCERVESFAWVDADREVPPHLVVAFDDDGTKSTKVFRPWQKPGFNFFGFREVEFVETFFMADVVAKEHLNTIESPSKYMSLFEHKNLNDTLVKVWLRHIKDYTAEHVDLYRVIKVSHSESYALLTNFWADAQTPGPKMPYVWMHWNGNQKVATCVLETNVTYPIIFFVGRRGGSVAGEPSVPPILMDLMYPAPSEQGVDYFQFQQFLLHARQLVAPGDGTTMTCVYLGCVFIITSIIFAITSLVLTKVFPGRRVLYQKRLERIGQESLFPVVAELHAFVAQLPPPPPPLVTERERVGPGPTLNAMKSMMERPKTDKLLQPQAPPSEGGGQGSGANAPGAAPSSGGVLTPPGGAAPTPPGNGSPTPPGGAAPTPPGTGTIEEAKPKNTPPPVNTPDEAKSQTPVTPVTTTPDEGKTKDTPGANKPEEGKPKTPAEEGKPKAPTEEGKPKAPTEEGKPKAPSSK